jgi:hypothetical protein
MNTTSNASRMADSVPLFSSWSLIRLPLPEIAPRHSTLNDGETKEFAFWISQKSAVVELSILADHGAIRKQDAVLKHGAT